jgi:cysteine desulfurase / selenocysteine lyase
MNANAMNNVDFYKIRNDFPILKREIKPGVRLIYLDSAATSQKPDAVINAMNHYYTHMNANIHRGVHALAEESTEAYEGARQRIASFIHAKKARELIFTRNTTESINLVAYSWARANLKAGDLIILTEIEHHSNLVPWQILASERGIRLEFIPIDSQNLLDLNEYHKLLEQKPKLVSFVHMSNVLGTITPAKEIIQAAHDVGAVTLVDGAQSAPHFPVDVQDLGADFFAFSAHKMCGPTGIGALYGREELLEAMPPFMGGGDMIKKVTLRSFIPNDLPHKFEAGTPAIAEVIGFGAAVDYLTGIGMDKIAAHEREITSYALESLHEIPGLGLIGPNIEHKGGVAAFTLENVHPHDIAQILDGDGIAVRAGHHCAMPLHEKLEIPASTRASFYFYTVKEEIDQLVKSILKVSALFK